MRRLFKKYNFLLWLGLLLTAGLLINSAAMLVMSRDMLFAHSAQNTLPLMGENLASRLQLQFAHAQSVAARLADDATLREWLSAEDSDTGALIAHLKASRQKDNSIAHFVVSEKDQRYIDSLGTVRSISQEDYRDAWYNKSRDSKRPVDVSIEPDFGGDNRPVIIVSAHIVDAEHQTLGMSGVSLPLNLFAADTPGSAAGLEIYFVDQTGKIVLSNSNKVGNIHRQEGLKELADALLADHAHQQNLSFEQGSAHVSLNARFIPELNWHLIVEDNTQNLTPVVMPLAYVNAAIGFIMTIAALILAWFSIASHQTRMRALASKDSMTGLMNRQSFTNSFQQTVLEMQRLQLPLSFILFDIDYLKKINESLGHATGDKIIMDIARLSKRSVRGSDLLCRWGGEQFAILLKRCELEQAYKVAEQLRVNVQNHEFSFDEQIASVTISLGVAEITDNESLDELFARVDEAVFLAKSEGRNRAEISYYINV